MEDDFERLFQELNQEYAPPKKLSEGEKVVKEAEERFTGYEEEEKSRREEISSIEGRIKVLQQQFSKNKNVKNPKMKEINDKRASKRADIKKEIERLRFTLDEIQKETAHLK